MKIAELCGNAAMLYWKPAVNIKNSQKAFPSWPYLAFLLIHLASVVEYVTLEGPMCLPRGVRVPSFFDVYAADLCRPVIFVFFFLLFSSNPFKSTEETIAADEESIQSTATIKHA